MDIKEDILNTLKAYKMFISKESEQTKEMLIIFKDLLHNQLGGNTNPTEDEIKEAIEQLKDVGKITALIPLVILPGSVIVIPLLIKLGKRYDIDILPKN
ncbi:MAG: hypothetical protein KAJ49_01720 [Arcobacteraceae bacterium]|nr:hypothetical protein [Arcobacteraceae bacterium]